MGILQSLRSALQTVSRRPESRHDQARQSDRIGNVNLTSSEASEFLAIVNEHEFLYVESIVPVGLRRLIEDDAVAEDDKLRRMASHVDLQSCWHMHVSRPRFPVIGDPFQPKHDH